MANTIRHKRNSTASAIPTAGSLSTGELAINTADGKLFLKKDNSSVVEIGGAAAAGTLTGTTLASNVVTSSLTQVGTLEFLNVTNTIGGNISGNAATATSASNALTANIATSASTVSTAAQPAITSVGTLTAVNTSGVITGTNTTASTSSTTGAVILSGGVGIAKDSHINSQRIGVGLLANTTNLAVGANALAATITGGINNTAIGSGCGSGITSGSQNTLLGYAVGTLVTTGAGNCSIGYASLNQNTVGNYNTAMGYGALQNTTASNNTAVGISALGSITTGALNVGIGREAGNFHADGTTALTTAGSSVYIGYNSKGLNNSDSNSIVIGALAVGLGANTTVIGTSATTETKLFGQLTLNGNACISAASATALALKSIVPAGTGVTPTVQIICPSAAYTLTNGTATQAVFNTGMRTITLQASTTYMFEGQYLITAGAGTVSHTKAISFVLTTATMTSCNFSTVVGSPNTLNAGATGAFTGIFNAVTGGVVNGATTATNCMIRFQGIMRVNAGGTLVPNIAFSAAPGTPCTTLVGSYLKFYPIGANTVDFVGTAIG